MPGNEVNCVSGFSPLRGVNVFWRKLVFGVYFKLCFRVRRDDFGKAHHLQSVA